jgi:hypothetical protein
MAVNSTGFILISTDGINWTSHTTTSNLYWSLWFWRLQICLGWIEILESSQNDIFSPHA